MAFYRSMMVGTSPQVSSVNGFFRCDKALKPVDVNLKFLIFNYFNKNSFNLEFVSVAPTTTSDTVAQRVDTGNDILQQQYFVYSTSSTNNSSRKNWYIDKLYPDVKIKGQIYLNPNCYKLFGGVGLTEISLQSYNVTNFTARNIIDWSNFQYLNTHYVTNAAYMFYGGRNFNIPVDFSSVVNCSNAFAGCNNFNQPITIPLAENCSNAFAGCYNFNQPITIPSTVTNCHNMFYQCYSFNQPIVFQDTSLTSYNTLFNMCYNFNQPITIPANATECQNMFIYCHNFNQPITIPNNVTNCTGMFKSCINLNQSIIIPPNVTDCYQMFAMSGVSNWANTNSKISNVYVKGTSWRAINTYMMFARNNGSNNNATRYNRVNIYFHSSLQNQFNKTSASTSLTGMAITWTKTTNGYYNAKANIYLYNNYSG